MKNLSERKERSVAMYISSFYPNPMGGMEMQGLRLAKQLKAREIEVTIFTHGFKEGKKEDIYEGIQIVRLHSWLNTAFSSLQTIKQKLSRRKFIEGPKSEASFGKVPYNTSDTDIKINGNFVDLIYYCIQFLNFAWYLKWCGKKYRVLHVHGVPWVSFIGTLVGRIYHIPIVVKESTTIGLQKFDDILFGQSMRRYVIKHAHFVAISRFIYTTMRQFGIPEKRIYYIPNGVTIPETAALETNQELNILFVGNLTQGAAKGLDVLLQALKIVIQHYPDIQLLIAGSVSERELWSQYLTSLGIEEKVVLLGSKNNMSEIYNRTTLFVSPSRREGLSNALLEAMAFGLPCIVTNISGSQDMIENERNGYVVEPDNVEELSGAIIKMLSSKSTRQVMRVSAHEKVKENCSFEKIASDYDKIYSLLLK